MAGIGLAFGQGRKPKTETERWLGGNAGHRRRAGDGSQASDDLPVPDPPRGMTQQQRNAWRELAPSAAAMRTLTVETQPAFRELVEMVVMKRRMYARIQRDGFMVPMGPKQKGVRRDHKVHPLMSSYRSMMQMVQIGFHRFRLAPIGKEVIPVMPAQDDDWDEFDDGVVQDGVS